MVDRLVYILDSYGLKVIGPRVVDNLISSNENVATFRLVAGGCSSACSQH